MTRPLFILLILIATVFTTAQAQNTKSQAKPAAPPAPHDHSHMAKTTETSSPAQQYFTDVELINQDGKKVRFYSDVLKGKTVVVNAFFTSCTSVCPPMNRNMEKIQEALGDRVGRDVFLRGAPEGLRLVRKSAWRVRDFDLFAAYGVVRARTQPAMHVVHARSVMTLDEAIERVGRMIGAALEWTFLESFLPTTQDPQFRRSALASSFLAMLELARLGRLEFVQTEPFAPIQVKAA